MKIRSKVSRALIGSITVPGDKSISHRSIILGAIAKGQTTVENFLEGEDCLSTLKAFQLMGVAIERPTSQHLLIHGVGKLGLKKPTGLVDCGNSGTSIRLLAGLLSAQPFDTTLIGDASLSKRPMQRVSKPLTMMGANIATTEGGPPLLIKATSSLQGIAYEMPEASAQVKSCLLLAGMYAKGTTTVLEPGLTRNHTENMLDSFSYPLEIHGNSISISSKSECIGTHITVPGDISSAAFYIVAAILIPDSQLTINNVGINPTRTGILEILTRMGATIRLTNQRFYGKEPVADIKVCYSELQGISIPSNLVPLAIDEFPIIFIAAAQAKGKTILHGASELRGKESDRISVMAKGLNTLGINAEALPDGISITGGQIVGGSVESHHDHRIAMAFTVAGWVSKREVFIEGCETIATSFPNFLSIAKSLNLAIEEC